MSRMRLPKGPTLITAPGETYWTTSLGSTVIISRIASPAQRMNFETRLPSCVEVGLEGWERVHSQGAGTGHESAQGIFYAPPHVNQVLQNHGIEQFIRHLYLQKGDHVDLYLITETRGHGGTKRLRDIVYEIWAAPRGTSLDLVRERGNVLFDVEIWVENTRDNPKVGYTATQRSHELDKFLK